MKLEIFIHKRLMGYDAGTIQVFSSDMSDYIDGGVLLGSIEVDVELPEVDERGIMIARIEKKIEKVRAESQATLTNLQGQINDLLALPAGAKVEVESDVFSDDIPF